MTIEQFQQECAKRNADWKFVSSIIELWSTNSCLGYVLAALKAMEYEDEEIEQIIGAVRIAFEEFSLAEADELFQRSQF